MTVDSVDNLIVLTYAVILVGGLLLAKPQHIMLGLIAGFPIITLFWDVNIGPLSLIDVIVGLFPTVFAVRAVFEAASGRWRYGRLTAAYLLFCSAFIYPAILLVQRGQPLVALEIGVKLLVPLVTYLLVLNYFPLQHRWRFFLAAATASLLTIAIVLFQLVTGIGTGYSRFSYLVGFYGNEANLTRMAVITLALALPYGAESFASRHKTLCRFMVVMALVILGLALSRNATLAAIVVLMVHAVIERKMRVVLLVALLGAAMVTQVDVIRSNYENKLGKEIRYLEGQAVNPDALGSGRVGRWGRAVAEFERGDLMTRAFGTGRTIGPHGEFFDLLRMTGVYGILMFLLFYGRVTRYIAKEIQRNRGDPFPVYAMSFMALFWTLCIGASPLWEVLPLMLLFGFVALVERRAEAGAEPAPRSYAVQIMEPAVGSMP